MELKEAFSIAYELAETALEDYRFLDPEETKRQEKALEAMKDFILKMSD